MLSRVLLRRFAVDDGHGDRVIRFDLRHESETRRPVSAVGYVKNFITHEPAAAEALWSSVEARMPEVFMHLDVGDLRQSPELVEIMKQFIALHFLRRERTKVAFNRSAEFAVGERLRAYDERVELHEQAVLWALGRPAVGPADFETAREAVEARYRSILPEALHINATQLFARAQTDVRRLELQIGTVEAGELLLSDIGVVSFNERLEVSADPLFGTDNKFLPVGPRHVVSLASTADDRFLAPPHVDALNRLSVLAADSTVFYRPNAGLSSFVRAVRPAKR